MPIYEYECQNCGEIEEKIMKMSDPEPENCGHCQKGPIGKVVSKSSFQLKGTGWYETDFKGSGKKDKAPAPPCATTGSCPAK